MNSSRASYLRTLFTLSLFLVQFSPLATPSSWALDSVTVQLKWTHAFQFAGYYAAKELGYYQEAGLDVNFQEAQPGVDAVTEVMTGNANFGVGTSSLLLAKKAGQPVVVLAVIFQHSPYILISGSQGNTANIHDIAGKRIMMEPLSNELRAYLKREGIPIEGIIQQEHSFNPQDLIDGKTDAISAYVTNQPYFLKQAKYRYEAYSPRSAGIDFYGDNLFTSEHEIKQHPNRVKAFRAASLRGWEYAMAHPEEIIELIRKKYSSTKTADYLRFEAAQMAPLIQEALIAIGYMNPGRWRHIADTYSEIGMLPKDFQLNGFLYEPNPQIDLRRIYIYLAIALLALGIISGIALYFLRINKRLKRSQAELTATLEAIPDLLFELDEEGNYLEIKTTHSTLFTAKIQKLIGKNIKDVLPPEATSTLMECLLAAGQSGSDYGRVILLPLNQNEFHFELSVARKTSAHSGYNRFIVLARDITARVVAENKIRVLNEDLEARVLTRTAELATARSEAESANAVKTGFMANVSHEMRTPLTGILGFAEIGKMRATKAQATNFVEYFENIKSSGQRLHKLVESLLTLTSQSLENHAGIAADQLEPVDLESIVFECTVSMDKIAKQKDQCIVLEKNAEFTQLHGDPVRLRQAIEYLIHNALRYSAPGKNVNLLLSNNFSNRSPGKPSLILEILDEGCGIPEAELTAIFEPFYESSRTATGSGGTGLGLPLSHSIIKRHQGTLTASNRESGGANFKIQLPCAPQMASSLQ
ncbi:MAG: ABC transporter substrate-binding protein [Nitrosomonas ureae]